MISEEQITITFSPETSKRLRSKAAQRGYGEGLERLVEDGLDALEPHDLELERWLREEVVPTCEELDRDPRKVLSFEQSGAELRAEYARFREAD